MIMTFRRNRNFVRNIDAPTLQRIFVDLELNRGSEHAIEFFFIFFYFNELQ